MSDKPASAIKRSILVLLLAIGTGCTTTTQRQHRVEAESNINRVRAGVKHQLAVQALNAGRFDEAATGFLEAVDLDPTTPKHHRDLAKCYLEQGRIADSMAETDTASFLGDQSAELTYLQGVIAERRQRIDEALLHYALARKREPTNVDYLLAEIETLVTLGKPEQARTLINRYLEDLDRDQRLLLLRAHIAVMQGDLNQAAADFAAAGPVTLETDWHAEQYGLALARIERCEEAERVLEPLLSAAPRSPHAVAAEQPPSSMAATRALAACFIETQRIDQAVSLLRRHVGDHPRDAAAWKLLARIALMQSDWRAARFCIQAGDSADPDRREWDLMRGFIAWKAGDPSTAQGILDRLLEQHPDTVEALCMLGEIHDERQAPQLARACFESALRIDPQCRWAKTRLNR